MSSGSVVMVVVVAVFVVVVVILVAVVVVAVVVDVECWHMPEGSAWKLVTASLSMLAAKPHVPLRNESTFPRWMSTCSPPLLAARRRNALRVLLAVRPADPSWSTV